MTCAHLLLSLHQVTEQALFGYGAHGSLAMSSSAQHHLLQAGSYKVRL